MEGIERVLEYCFKQKEKLLDFYQKTGIDDARVSAIRKRKSGMPEEVIIAISSAYPELNMHWVLTGKGEMLLRVEAGSLQQINNVNNGVMENSPLTATYKAGLCAECEEKLQESNEKIIKLQDEIISLYKKQTQ